MYPYVFYHALSSFLAFVYGIYMVYISGSSYLILMSSTVRLSIEYFPRISTSFV
uniref:Uncharacterized protein n=1 Tax=Setaria viridis TaxID=4556 RepID=A0A4U6W3F1_SETVI|nr:hypothetical protein SEVIR_2G447150v2 [Setaria viridis]